VQSIGAQRAEIKHIKGKTNKRAALPTFLLPENQPSTKEGGDRKRGRACVCSCQEYHQASHILLLLSFVAVVHLVREARAEEKKEKRCKLGKAARGKQRPGNTQDCDSTAPVCCLAEREKHGFSHRYQRTFITSANGVEASLFFFTFLSEESTRRTIL
jgi:hypothetical protein